MAQKTSAVKANLASFRDPSGAVFSHEGKLYRQVDQRYKANYDKLMDGLYQELVEAGLLVEHKEVPAMAGLPKTTYKVIQPKVVPFISYPYEWSFSQLQDAALITLRIQKNCYEARYGVKRCQCL